MGKWVGGMVWVAVAGMVTITGCGPKQSEEAAEREQSNIKYIAIMYGTFVGQHRGNPPRNEAEFKQHIQKNTALLEQLKVKNVDELLISPRDNEHYVVAYGRKPPQGQYNGQPITIVAFEKTGVNGTRLAASDLGQVVELTEEEFQQAAPAAK